MRYPRRSVALFLSTAVLRQTTGTAFISNSKSVIPRGHNTLLHRTAMTSSSSSSILTALHDATARVALCQFHVTSDKSQNHQTASEYLRRAKEQGAQLAVLPEIWNGPYATAAFPDYAEELPNVGDTSSATAPSAQLLIDLARQLDMWIVGGSVSEVTQDGKIYNTCLVMNPSGEIVAKHRKVHLFDIDVPNGITFRESDTLSPGGSLTVFDGGDLFGMVGVGICYDIRFPEYALLLGKTYNCNILIYPGAFNLTTGPAHWELLQRARAVDNQCYVLTAAPARSEEDPKNSKYPHYTSWGHSTAVSPWGDVVATCDEKEALLMVDLDMNKVQEMRQGIPVREQKRYDLYTLQAPDK